MGPGTQRDEVVAGFCVCGGGGKIGMGMSEEDGEELGLWGGPTLGGPKSPVGDVEGVPPEIDGGRTLTLMMVAVTVTGWLIVGDVVAGVVVLLPRGRSEVLGNEEAIAEVRLTADVVVLLPRGRSEMLRDDEAIAGVVELLPRGRSETLVDDEAIVELPQGMP